MSKASRTHRMILMMIFLSTALCYLKRMSGSETVGLWTGLFALWIGGKGWVLHVSKRGS